MSRVISALLHPNFFEIGFCAFLWMCFAISFRKKLGDRNLEHHLTPKVARTMALSAVASSLVVVALLRQLPPIPVPAWLVFALAFLFLAASFLVRMPLRRALVGVALLVPAWSLAIAHRYVDAYVVRSHGIAGLLVGLVWPLVGGFGMIAAWIVSWKSRRDDTRPRTG